MNANVLVIGASSILGRSLVEKFKKNQVYTAGRRPGNDVYVDFENGKFSVPKDLRCDYIAHCASSFGGDDPFGGRLNAIVNIAGIYTVGAISQAVEAKKIVYASSISAYRHPENQYFGSYGISKLHAEEHLALICTWLEISFAAIRYSQFYDDNGLTRKHQPLFFHILNMAKLGRKIVIYGKHDPLRNFLHISDAAAIMERTILSDFIGVAPAIHPRSITLSQFAHLAFKIFGNKPDVEFDASQANLKSIYIPSDLSLYDQIQREPQIQLQEGLRKLKTYQNRWML